MSGRDIVRFGYLVEISEERLDDGVLLAELRCPLLAVLGGPGGEHAGAWSRLQQGGLCSAVSSHHKQGEDISYQ